MAAKSVHQPTSDEKAGTTKRQARRNDGYVTSVGIGKEVSFKGQRRYDDDSTDPNITFCNMAMAQKACMETPIRCSNADSKRIASSVGRCDETNGSR